MRKIKSAPANICMMSNNKKNSNKNSNNNNIPIKVVNSFNEKKNKIYIKNISKKTIIGIIYDNVIEYINLCGYGNNKIINYTLEFIFNINEYKLTKKNIEALISNIIIRIFLFYIFHTNNLRVDVPIIDLPLKIDVPIIDLSLIDLPKIDVPIIDLPKIDVPIIDLPIIKHINFIK